MSPAKKKPGKKQPSSDPLDNDDPNLPVFFHMPQEKWPWRQFCQWYPSVFTVSKQEISALCGREVDPVDPYGSITVTCAEQFMMYCKAAYSGDTERQARIMQEKDPKEQKKLGKSTVGFSDARWDDVKSKVVEMGSIAKFGQNPHLKAILMSTGERLLVEASRTDRIWGIGFKADEAMVNQANWGENRLGKALMETRRLLREEEAQERMGTKPKSEKDEEDQEEETTQDIAHAQYLP
ncbi:hypothetical protein CFIO01_08175 [Colletotrichum fioriniae PJ7]|uniref:NADAR domain-containing protein n=1 Tax=Colletotrichum fioriniae PJ7 TaxID=1445577 RepID=A0A010SC03_9PEZI|nr:hypothetical protein CFIO01_08175 [Colletotrichum fioriniae PJ7]